MQFSIQFRGDGNESLVRENAQLNELRGRIVGKDCTLGSGKVIYRIIHVYRYGWSASIMATIRNVNRGFGLSEKLVALDKLIIDCGDVDESDLLNFDQDDYQNEITSILKTGKSLHKSY